MSDSGRVERREALALERLAGLIERRVVPLLERVVTALEGLSGVGGPSGRSNAPAEEAQVTALRERLFASIGVNDPVTVLSIHHELSGLLVGEALAELDCEVLRWSLHLIERRMRAGAVSAEIVELAGTVADRFGHTMEGASLRASLPVLRRSAGLCPSCGEPYVGIDRMCPRCAARRAGPIIPASVPSPSEPPPP